MMRMKLNEICEVYSGYALKSFNDAEDGLPVVKIGNILTDGTLNLDECQYTTDSVNEKYYSNKGDIYIALSGATTGKIGIMDADERYVVNQRVGIVRKKSDDVPQEYIKYFLLRQTDRILQEAAGCAQPNISPKQIAEYSVPEITKEKMFEVCGVLDKTKRIIDMRKAELTALDDLIKARFVELFGDPATNEKGFIKAPMGDYMTLLTDFSSNGSYKTLDSGVTMYDEPNFAWMVRTTDLESGDMTAIKYIDENAYELLAKSKIYGGEIIMNKIGSAGKIYLMPQIDMPASLGRNAFMFRYDERINVKFLYHLLTSEYGQREIQQYVRGAVTKTITKNDARAVLIIVPPIELQNEFEALVEQVDKSKVAVQKALDETQLLFDSLMQEYFG